MFVKNKMNYKTILSTLEIFNNIEPMDFEKVKFVGDCHGDLLQFLFPLAGIISVEYIKKVNSQNIIFKSVNVKILKNFKKPIIYYLGDLFSSFDNEMDYVIEQIIFQILHSSKIVKWIVGNHDILKFEKIVDDRILKLIQQDKIVLCEKFKGRLLSHTCFTYQILHRFFHKTFNITRKIRNSSDIISLINNTFYNLVKEKRFKDIINDDILWNRIQNDCFKSIVGHTPGLCHYCSYDDIDENLFLDVNCFEFIDINEYIEKNVEQDFKSNFSLQNVLTETTTYAGRCKQVFKNDMFSTEDETEEENKDNLRHVAVIDFGCSYEKNDVKFGYLGISMPDFLYYDTCGIYKLTNFPVYIYLYTEHGIEIKTLTKEIAFSHIDSAVLINHIIFKNDKPLIIKRHYCDVAVYVYEFINEFKDKLTLIKFVCMLFIIVLISSVTVMVINSLNYLS